MKTGSEVVREFYPGMGQAVAERTILRKKADGSWETWGDVAKRVASGNAYLEPNEVNAHADYWRMRRHLNKASLLMSGRHLEHGDENEASKPMEVFTNCSTACAGHEAAIASSSRTESPSVEASLRFAARRARSRMTATLPGLALRIVSNNCCACASCG